jgi:antitoxin component YwqK of YwqJK toxin-antitoxin module
MKRFLLVIAFLASSLSSFTPGKWSPMDGFTLGLEKFGPSSEVVKNKNGEVIYSAEYEYDANGKLIKEKFKDQEGKPHGETFYIYEKGKLASEELFGPDNMLQEKKIFKYLDGILREATLLAPDGKEIYKCRINSIQGELITDGEIKWSETKDTEAFSMKKDPVEENVFNMEISDDKKKTLGVVKYYFKDGKPEKRINVQGNLERMSEIKYNSEGKPESVTFHVKQDGKWDLVKTHFFSYSKN